MMPIATDNGFAAASFSISLRCTAQTHGTYFVCVTIGPAMLILESHAGMAKNRKTRYPAACLAAGLPFPQDLTL